MLKGSFSFHFEVLLGMNIYQRFRWSIALLAILAHSHCASSVLAHEGHGQAGHGHTPQHYLSEPFHLVQLLAMAAVALLAGWFVLRKVPLFSK